MNLIQRIKAAWYFWRDKPIALQAIPDGFWTRGDLEIFTSFRRSDTGYKLNVLLANLIAKNEWRAVGSERNLERECGKACGIRATVSFLDALIDPDTLSQYGAQSVTFEELARQGAANDLAHLAP